MPFLVAASLRRGAYEKSELVLLAHRDGSRDSEQLRNWDPLFKVRSSSSKFSQDKVSSG